MFKRLENRFNLPQIEQDIIKLWQGKNILEKYLNKNQASPKRFSFLDGPITANNPMGVHHGWGRGLKDMYQRYKNMKGYCQRFQNGFDNQGLWVEVEVEKKLGFKSKRDIEHYGIAAFIEKCKEHTLHFAKVQTEQSKRLGYFMDWDNSYYTLSDANNFAIWHFIKECHKNNWLYKGEDVVPWCPRCGTAISQHEILTGDYKELTHQAVFVKYPVKELKKTYFLVWTTTPWTLPANVAVAVNPDSQYLFVKLKNEEQLILAKALAEKIIKEDYQAIKEVKGSELVGLKYESPFDGLERVKQNLQEHEAVAWKEGVTEEEGTGLVHLSTGSGPEDYDLGKEKGLPIFPVIDENGDYLSGYGFLTGQNAQNIAPQVIAFLEQKNFLYAKKPYAHRYPLCWRCKTPLLFRLVDEWYISMKELRQKMIEVAKEINWIPEFGLKLELDWLKNMDDWLISKKRYWGLSLPIWECSCGHFEVIGSKKELKEKAIEGWDEFEVHSPHRPWSDSVKIKCPKCGQAVSRIPDVGNPWLDAGIVPFSTLGYLENKIYWRQWFPADLVLECFPGQFKNWFYSLIAMSSVLEKTPPFKNLLGHALVRDEQGREMHKSWGNAIEFNEAADKMGADLMRWLYMRQNPAYNINFGFGPADDLRKQFFLILWNCYKFLINYSAEGLEAKEPEELKAGEGRHPLDKWILSRLNRLIFLVEKRFDSFDHSPAVLAIESFVIDDLSTWYIRRSRKRISFSNENESERINSFATLYQVLLTLDKLIAPMIPFLSEKLWQSLFGKGSVHLSDWPQAEKKLINEPLEEKMLCVRRICSMAHALRKENNIKVRQPLRAVWLEGASGLLREETDLLDLIKEELNVREVEFGINLEERKELAFKKEGSLKIGLETVIDQSLEEEGLAREVIRHLQQARKKAGLLPGDRIEAVVFAPKAILEIVVSYSRQIKEAIAADIFKVFESQDQEALRILKNFQVVEFAILQKTAKAGVKKR